MNLFCYGPPFRNGQIFRQNTKLFKLQGHVHPAGLVSDDSQHGVVGGAGVRDVGGDTLASELQQREVPLSLVPSAHVLWNTEYVDQTTVTKIKLTHKIII